MQGTTGSASKHSVAYGDSHSNSNSNSHRLDHDVLWSIWVLQEIVTSGARAHLESVSEAEALIAGESCNSILDALLGTVYEVHATSGPLN